MIETRKTNILDKTILIRDFFNGLFSLEEKDMSTSKPINVINMI
jgi:hypothetical protein